MDTTATLPLSARRLARASLAFAAIGALLYALLYFAAEQLMYRHGQANPYFKMVLNSRSPDWIVLGASHAMPLAFGGFNETMERATGMEILNLAATGAGPLYNRLVLEHFLRHRRAANVLYVVDSFAFYSPAWNEERIADAKLLARTPFDPQLASALAGYARHEGVDWRAWLDYVSGFSKINNRDRFKTDSWEGEAQFDKAWRPSVSAVKKRIDYLYPAGTPPAQRERYLAQLGSLIEDARAAGARVVLVKLPTPAAYRSQLPDEPAFDAAIAASAARAGAAWLDFSDALAEPRLYFDSDHLNRAGVTEFFERHLKGLLALPGRAETPR